LIDKINTDLRFKEGKMEFRMHHTAISVRDMAESIAFYEQFGFAVARHYQDPDMEIAHLRLGEAMLEIFWYRDQVPAPKSAGELSSDLPRIGVKHFALQVESIEQAKQFAENGQLADQITIRQGKTGVRYFFLKDPSGNLFEILETTR
jgi:glyoxylase I family protein